jgi:hypothetical protein
MIDPGDDWDPAIQRELGAADVVIFLTSAAALATDHVTKHELPKALQMRKERKMEVVPIILEKCRWEPTGLGALQALPEKGKPVTKWDRSSDAWNSVADRLAKVLTNVIEQRKGEGARGRSQRGPALEGVAPSTPRADNARPA